MTVAGRAPRVRARRATGATVGLVGWTVADGLGTGRRHRPAEPVPHARPPPPPVPRLAALRRPADARRHAAPPRDRAGDPPRRPPARLRLRARAPPSASAARAGVDRRGRRAASTDGPTARRLVAARAGDPRRRRRAARARATSPTTTWAALRAHLDDRELIELVLLVGHYEMLATTITTLRIEPDAHR